MRNYVQKVFVGKGIAYKEPFDVDGVITLAEDEMMAFDWETKAAVTADSQLIGFHLGSFGGVVTGPVNVKLRMNNYTTPYAEQVAQKVEITVDATPIAGESAMFKILAHDNLSIVPNQMKQIFASVVGIDGEAVEDFAARLGVELAGAMKQRNFATIEVAGAVITVTSDILDSYNNINRPETIYVEVGIPTQGEYTVVETAGIHPNGTPNQVMWMEDLYQGRYGFSDRTNWNAKKYPHQADASLTYDIFTIDANIDVEGDMQDVRFNPVGMMMALEVGESSALVGELDPVLKFMDLTSVVPAPPAPPAP